MKKYELVKEDCLRLGEVTVYRIRALKDISNLDHKVEKVKAGDLGGYIESERNLSQEGNAWIYDDATVFGEASVCDDATVGGKAVVWGNAKVRGNAGITDNAKVYDNAYVGGFSSVNDNAEVYGHAHISKDVALFDYVKVYDEATVSSEVSLHSDAQVCGNGEITSCLLVGKGAVIKSKKDIVWFSSIGSEFDTITAYKTELNKIVVMCDSFIGSPKEFKRFVKNFHGADSYKTVIYKSMIKNIKRQLKNIR